MKVLSFLFILVANVIASDQICVQANSMREAYELAEKQMKNVYLVAKTRVADINGDTSSSSDLVQNKSLLMVSKTDSTYCFVDNIKNALITSNKDIINKDLPTKKKREVSDVISQDYVAYYNTNIGKLADAKYVTTYDRTENPRVLFEYNPPHDDFKAIIKKLDSLVPESNIGSWLTPYNNLGYEPITGKYSDSVYYVMRMYDCQGEYPYVGRIYKSPKTIRIYINAVIHYYNDTTIKRRWMLFGDGIFTKKLTVSSQAFSKKEKIQSVDIYFDIADENTPFVEYRFDIQDSSYMNSRFWRPQEKESKFKLTPAMKSEEKFERFPVITEDTWKSIDNGICYGHNS